MPPPSTQTAPPRPSRADARPVVAVIEVVATPYWVHLHRRIDAEIPEIEFHSLYTYDLGDQPWNEGLAGDIRPFQFGPGESCTGKPGPRWFFRQLFKGNRIIRWLRDQRVGAVILHGYNDPGRLRVCRWCKARGVPCFVSGDNNIHADTAAGVKGAAKKALVSWVVRSVAGVMPFGTAGAQFFQRYGATPDRIFLRPGEPDYSLIDSITPQDARAVQERLGLAPGRRRIVYCGRLAKVKRVDLLCDSFVAIAAQRPDWDLVIVGDGPLLDSLKARIPASLGQRVFWTGFIGDPRQIAAIYRSCDVLALPSDLEPWALVVNEAMAAGLAIVASDVVGAAVDLVKPGVNGRIFESGNLIDLRESLLEVTRPGVTDRMRAASAGVLAEWRARADPIQGIRRALESVGVIASSPHRNGAPDPLKPAAVPVHSRPDAEHRPHNP